MPSYQELQEEDAWQDEYSPPALMDLALNLEAHWPGARCYIRGDNSHLRGYHRSRRWISESIYCTNHTYSVSRTTGDRSGGDPNWSCALDLTGLTQPELHGACQRLDEACRAGRLEKITEWYGNLGNDSLVDGWDNIANRPATSDSSHLTHLHLSFDRGRANEDHLDLLQILTGDDMTPQQEQEFDDLIWRVDALWANTDLRGGRYVNDPVLSQNMLKDAIEQIPDPPVAEVDIDALVTALTPVIHTIVRQELDATKLGQL